MNILSVSEAKMKLSALVESLKNTEEEVIITKNGLQSLKKNNASLYSLEELLPES
ncbi:MAG: type II toxin-antitoxin system Phd/YefM family antitoxin [Desulfobacteraceae bacterium]|nr:type II toxin-antitoxin system Phd/YefM family antitoxin [Desulfobacteraceae bacterium]MCF8095093.1 type II toxin-antitoxin system Phd/YefM family antitoxin [Desulfobacteraceae bacterium]